MDFSFKQVRNKIVVQTQDVELKFDSYFHAARFGESLSRAGRRQAEKKGEEAPPRKEKKKKAAPPPRKKSKDETDNEALMQKQNVVYNAAYDQAVLNGLSVTTARKRATEAVKEWQRENGYEEKGLYASKRAKTPAGEATEKKATTKKAAKKATKKAAKKATKKAAKKATNWTPKAAKQVARPVRKVSRSLV